MDFHIRTSIAKGKPSPIQAATFGNIFITQELLYFSLALVHVDKRQQNCPTQVGISSFTLKNKQAKLCWVLSQSLRNKGPVLWDVKKTPSDSWQSPKWTVSLWERSLLCFSFLARGIKKQVKRKETTTASLSFPFFPASTSTHHLTICFPREMQRFTGVEG